ncbi:oxidoreductase [Acephala macrosclerotiorum]|nr:oxidoreductase [Acephala macrosclerotiorum]
MVFPYKHAVLIGATAGIGKGMADKLIDSGIKVTAVGRRQDRINDFIKQHGKTKASGVPYDITNYKKAPQFAAEVMKKFPDVDCLFLNAGVQRKYDLAEFDNVDLEEWNYEMTANYTGLVALTHAFLPYLKKKKQASIVFTGANLAFVPAAVFPNYCASKTALNIFTMCLREQLKVAESPIKVIEISPGPVQTELHGYMGDAGSRIGMPLDDFTSQVTQELIAGKDQIIVGLILDPTTFTEIVDKRRILFENVASMMRKRAT